LIYLGLFISGMYLIWHFSGSLTAILPGDRAVSRWIGKLENGWVNFLFILLGLAVRLVFLSFYFSLFKYIIMVLGAPFFARLSSLTEHLVNPRAPSSGEGLSGSIKLVGRNLLLQSCTLVLLLLLSFIPIAGWVTPMLCFFLECYFFGFSLLDHTRKQYGFSYRQGILFIRRHRGLAIGNGLGFYLLMFIPVVGWILGPSYAIIAATLSFHQKQ